MKGVHPGALAYPALLLIMVLVKSFLFVCVYAYRQ